MIFEQNKIQRVFFDVQYPEQSSAQVLQDRIISQFNDKIIRILEKKLEGFEPTKLLRIPKVELNLGTLSKVQAEDSLAYLFEKKLEEYLGNIKVQFKSGMVPPEVEAIEVDEIVVEFLIHYFNFGTFSWKYDEIASYKKVEEWIIYLSESSPEKLKEIRPYFAEEGPRFRIVKLLKELPYSKSEKLIKALLTKEGVSDYQKSAMVVGTLVQKFKTIEAEKIAYLINNFPIWLVSTTEKDGGTIQNLKKIANLFTNFIEISPQINPSQISRAVFTIDSKSLISHQEQEFFQELKNIYYKDITGTYIQHLQGIENERLTHLTKNQFDTYIANNYLEQEKLLQDFSEKLIDQIKKQYPNEEESKLSMLMRGVFLDSLRSAYLPDEYGVFLNKLEKELFFVFGTTANTAINSVISKETERLKNKFGDKVELDIDNIPSLELGIGPEDQEKRSSDAQGYKPEDAKGVLIEGGQRKSGEPDTEQKAKETDSEIDKHGKPIEPDEGASMEQQDGFRADTKEQLKEHKGGLKYVRLQHATQYLELFLRYGPSAVQTILGPDIKNFESVVEWLVEKHPGIYRKTIQQHARKISPLVLYQMQELSNKALIEDVLQVTASTFLNDNDLSVPITFGDAILLEILQKGSIGTTDFQEIGKDTISKELTAYFENNKDAVLKLFNNFPTKLDKPLIQYLLRLTISHKRPILQSILKEIGVNDDSVQLMDLVLPGIADIEDIPEQLGQSSETIAKPANTLAKSKEGGKQRVSKFKRFDKTVFQFALPQFYANLLSPLQIEQLAAYVEHEVKLRSEDIAMFFITVGEEKRQRLIEILQPPTRSRIAQLVRAYHLKYQPQTEKAPSTSETKDTIGTIESGNTEEAGEKSLADADTKIKSDEKEKEEKSTFKRFKEGEILYVRNSGMVLLNPYLTTLFNKTSLLENKKFVSNSAKLKAMQLMQYIATTTEMGDEDDFMLNKVLVGVDPYEPIGTLKELSKEEKELCDSLLNAILSRWSALKNTSPNNLRASFLIRNGKLVFEQANWSLVVEKHSIDILLGKLPWSFNLIKLPWMNYPLFTQWE